MALAVLAGGEEASHIIEKGALLTSRTGPSDTAIWSICIYFDATRTMPDC